MERSCAGSWKSRQLVAAFVIFCAAVHVSYAKKIRCREREKILATLDMIENCIIKTKNLETNCTAEEELNSSNNCSDRGAAEVFLDGALGLLKDAKGYYNECLSLGSKKRSRQKGDPADCSDILEKGQKSSGEYRIWPRNTKDNSSIKVFCDMETDGGGWTVIQRRGSYPNQEDFYRDWKTYAMGFGNVSMEFWIGNDNLHTLTTQDEYSLRFDLEDKDGEKGFATYKYFQVGDSASNYRLNVSGYVGDVGDCMTKHDGNMFSAKDMQNDENAKSDPCAQSSRGGWWYSDCYDCNPNGLLRQGVTGQPHTVRWNKWKQTEGLAFTEMKIRSNNWEDPLKLI